MTYYTISKNSYLVDSICDNFEMLQNKFPNETIYKSDKPLTSIYVVNAKI